MPAARILLCTSTRAYRENAVCIDLKRHLIYRDGRVLQFSMPLERHVYFKIVARLFLQQSEFVTFKEIAQYVYDGADGGPLDPGHAIVSAIKTFRAKLGETIGARIVSGGLRGVKIVW